MDPGSEKLHVSASSRPGNAAVLSYSIVDRLIGRGPEIRHHARRLRRIHHPLGQENAGELLVRVGIPGGTVAAIPAEPARRGVEIVALGEDRHSKTPAPAIVKKQLEAQRLLRRVPAG